MATNPNEASASTSPMFPFASMTTPYNPLSHWGNINLRHNSYMNTLNRTSITNTEEDETNINNYHNPRIKHYEEQMDKQRLEHILFSGDQTNNSLHQQKERMRQKLMQNNRRKYNNSTQMNGHSNENGTKKNNFTQQKKNKKNKNKNNNKKKHSKQKNKNKKNKKNNKKLNSKSPSQESQKTTDSNSNSVHALELDNNSNNNTIEIFGDGDAESESNSNELNGHSMENTIENNTKICEDNIIENINNSMENNKECNGNCEENREHKLEEIISNQSKEINVLKQNVLELSERMNGINEMKEEILLLKQRVTDIECMRINNSNHEQVRQWLKNEVGLEQYYHIFIDNGFDDMLSLKTLTMNILNGINGIDKIGHKSKILYFVEKLNQQNDSTHEF